MTPALLALLRCPFCGTALAIEDNDALRRTGDVVDTGVLSCQCCAFPVVDGIPVLIADDTVRAALHALEAGAVDRARELLLGLDPARAEAFRDLVASGTATYRSALTLLSPDAEGTYFLYRFSDPTFLQADTLVRAVGQVPGVRGRHLLDVCGGSGHLTHTLTELAPSGLTVLADIYFWKLWLARHFVAPGSAPVCCDGNAPLPVTADRFSLVVLSDAFPYIWHKRMLADEMMRAAGSQGVLLLPHLHSSRGENASAGMTLTPDAYRGLFASHGARLFGDATLLTHALGGHVDLAADVTSAELGDEPSLTIVASRTTDVFRAFEVPDATGSGEIRVNPLYRATRVGDSFQLTLEFPTPEYAEEFEACRRYLPDTVTLPVDPTGPLSLAQLGADGSSLLRRRVLLRVPPRYL